jgi:transcriptional antiterminator NusG
MASRFYVLQVMTGEEPRFLELARNSLERQHSADLRLWWPRRRLTVRRRGRRTNALAPLFPGYVIVEAREIDHEAFEVLRRCKGFVRFLKDNRNIHPLADRDLDLVRHFLSFGEVVEKSRVTFDVNNRIVVDQGPLKGLEGRIVKVDKRKGRAKVQLDLYDDSFLIDLGFEQIEGASR